MQRWVLLLLLFAFGARPAWLQAHLSQATHTFGDVALSGAGAPPHDHDHGAGHEHAPRERDRHHAPHPSADHDLELCAVPTYGAAPALQALPAVGFAARLRPWTRAASAQRTAPRPTGRPPGSPSARAPPAC